MTAKTVLTLGLNVDTEYAFKHSISYESFCCNDNDTAVKLATVIYLALRASFPESKYSIMINFDEKKITVETNDYTGTSNGFKQLIDKVYLSEKERMTEEVY